MRASTRLPLAGAALVLLASLVAGSAAASTLVGRNAHQIHLKVSRNGRAALLAWREDGRQKVVRAWGAINARAPSASVPQVQLMLNYAGGQRLRGGCRPYDGPKLGWVVQACNAQDGSYWAVQNWPRLVKPGQDPTAATWELHLSHWSGPIAQLALKTGWAARQYDEIYGQYTYLGVPIHGFHSTHQGAPLDTYGRNIYLDTLNSSYGSGWHRENGFLARKPNGGFCYAMYHAKGTAYRVSAVGPGVTPDIFTQVSAPGPYNRARDLAANAEETAILGKACH
jgi:hypothetical protein